MERTPITVIGSCVANQLLLNMPNYKSSWRLNFTSDDIDERFREKISASFTPAGNIADRLYEDMKRVVYQRKHYYTYETWYDLRVQLEYVTKVNSIEKTINHSKLTPNAVIYFDITNELLPTVVTQDEEFLLKNNWPQIKRYFPEWFQEFVAANTFQFDMYDKTMIMDRHHKLRKAVKIINSANQPVVAIGNVYTNKVYHYPTNTVAENLEFYNNATPFLKVDRNLDADPLQNYNYVKRHIDRFYKICQNPKMSPGWNWLDVEEYCFADPKHRYGPHPIHLHGNACKVIGGQLQELFKKVAIPVVPGL
jgi:hypothetical protein